MSVRSRAASERGQGRETPPRPPQRISRRLGTDAVEQILADYRRGLPSTVLANRHGISSVTVRALLRRHGIDVRHQPMTRAESVEAIRLYDSGWSLAKIGSKLDRPPNSIRNALIRSGVSRRSPNRRVAGS